MNISDVIVVGGGVIGSAAAYHLARRGAQVRLFDQYAPGHARGSSHGPSRIIRLAYETSDYVQLARAAFAGWRALAADTGLHLIQTAGGIDIGTPDAHGLAAIRATYDALGVPYDALDRQAIAARFPQFALPDDTIGLYQADYALLAADRCVAALTGEAHRRGAVLHHGETVQQIAVHGDAVEVVTNKKSYSAGRLVLAAGSWMRPLLHQLDLDLPLTVTKEQLAFYTPRTPAQYTPGIFPLVIHRFVDTTMLGSFFPTFDHTGVKCMLDRTGPEVAPEDDDRSIDAGNLAQLNAYVAATLPDLHPEPIEAVSCRYTMTPDEHFILDQHPAHPQVVIGSPCSGHGFKFGVVIGEILADLATIGATTHDIGRFGVGRFG